MDREQAIAYLQAQTVCALAEIEGMKAENAQRAVEGNSMAYVAKDFEAVMIKYGVHHNAAIETLFGYSR